MRSFLMKIGLEIVKLLPPALARLLLLSVIVAGIILHFSAREDIYRLAERTSKVEEAQSNSKELMREILLEIRGYRADILKQNEELRKGKP